MQALIASRQTINFFKKNNFNSKFNLSKKKMSSTAAKSAAGIAKSFQRSQTAELALDVFPKEQIEESGSIIPKDILGSPSEWDFYSFIEFLGPFIFLEFCFFLIASLYIYKSSFLPFYSE